METKDLIGLTLLPLGIIASITIMCLSQTVRDGAFFSMIVGAVLIDKLDVNFVSHYWYRGTTRGFEFSLIDILAAGLLASSLLVPRDRERRWFWPASLALMLLYLAYAAVSIIISEPKLFGLFELSKMLRAIMVFLAAAMFVRGEREAGILVCALGCAICFEGLLALKQRYLDDIFRVTGSIEHPNSLSMYICLTAPVMVAAATSNLPTQLRWFAYTALAFAAVSIMLTVSRAGIPIFAAVMLGTTAMCVSWRITLQKIVATAVICLVATGVIYRSWDILKARYGEATLKDEYLNEQIEGRGLYLRFAGAIIDEHLFGIGLNNWSYWVSKKYGPNLGWPYEDYDDLDYLPSKELLPSFHYAAPAHNLGALTLGELGVPGLCLFALLWLRWLQTGATFLWKRSTDIRNRLGVGIFFGTCGIFLQSVTEWTYRQTAILFTFHILLGTLASLHHWRRNPPSHSVKHVVQKAKDFVYVEPASAIGERT